MFMRPEHVAGKACHARAAVYIRNSGRACLCGFPVLADIGEEYPESLLPCTDSAVYMHLDCFKLGYKQGIRWGCRTIHGRLHADRDEKYE